MLGRVKFKEVAVVGGLGLWPIVAVCADAPAWAVAALALPSVVALHVSARRRDGWRLLGPHFYFDLIRMARKGRTAFFRIAFLLLLLGGIGNTYARWARPGEPQLSRPGPRNATPIVLQHGRPGEFNLRCVYTAFYLQNLAVLLLVPAYVGGAIAEERTRGTLDLLFATALYDREIVLGKLMARVLHLGAILLAGLPIFSLMQVWGGVDMTLIVENYVCSFLLLLAASGVCVAISTLPLPPTTCVLRSYAAMFVPACCCLGTFQGVWENEAKMAQFWVAAVIYLGVVAFFVVLAIRAVRLPEGIGPGTDHDALIRLEEHRASTREHSVAATTLYEELIPYVPPPVSDNALLWKECYTGSRSTLQWIKCFPVLAPLLLLLPVFVIAMGAPVAFGPVLVCWLVEVSFRAASCVVREREGRTLDMLFAAPVERVTILRAKLFGAILKAWLWPVVLLAIVMISALFGTHDPITMIALLIFLLLLVFCLCSVGVLVSVLAQTTLQANLVTASILLGLAAAAWTAQATFPARIVFETLAGDPPSLPAPGLMMLSGLAFGLVVFAALTWRLANFIFERTGR